MVDCGLWTVFPWQFLVRYSRQAAEESRTIADEARLRKFADYITAAVQCCCTVLVLESHCAAEGWVGQQRRRRRREWRQLMECRCYCMRNTLLSG